MQPVRSSCSDTAQPLPAEPLSQRFVIHLQDYVRQHYTAQEHRHRPGPCLGKRHARKGPGIEQVHKRIMNDIDRVGYVAKEPAHPPRKTSGHLTGSTDIDQKRKDTYDAERLIETVQPHIALSTDPGHRKQEYYRQRADPERSPHPPRPEAAGHQQTHSEREHQPEESTRKIEVRQRPAHPEMAETGEAAYRITRQAETGYRHHDSQPAGGQPAQDQRIEDVADIFEEQGPGRAVERIHLLPRTS